ncbi:hypothetical protein TBLA_0B04710 [Henningerozyma blattae CBS 6284]|uniref:Peptide transporter PTR2 n=1 Tax=Henningerozyma blattae (strain ATCC 34711 / CBS 6284 / DSM 70876 / NBRC 10599 / NRRL Y-10934 / UCD 77-7) TaxID=1071380 RepID=I2GYV5_HENB6|nr:hypothetical protein TBLA_0B04710 [Tetrapisispora blattae CBS 6284]CCH59307.1 hypothetical protein TBLA_0B04710 [Tetrapisispora blattae CBS 6284]
MSKETPMNQLDHTEISLDNSIKKESSVEKNHIKFDSIENTSTTSTINKQLTNDSDYDDMDDGDDIEPTEEELKTLPREAGHIPFNCWLLAIIELAERFSYYGLSAPFQNYMQNNPSDNPPGALSLNSTGATGLSYFFQFWCYVTPIFAGFMADTYWGKFNTLCIGTIIYIIGIFILFITSLPAITSYNTALGGFIVAIILIGIATGMIKANLSVMIADQLPKKKLRVVTKKKSGKRVIEDPQLTIQNVFMAFYFMINVGSLSVIATTELELHVGFWAAYLLPFCFFWIAVLVLAFGNRKFVKKPIGDRVISKCFTIIGILIKNNFNFQKAKPTYNPEKNYPWSDKFVDEIQRSLKACKVFLFYPIYWVCYGQMLNNFVTQGSTMQLHGLPNDFFQAINSIALIVFIPIVEKFVYPFIRKFTPLKPITKVTIGFVFGSLAMVWAAVLQHFIYQAGPCYDHPVKCPNGPNHVHVAWQVPAYCLISLSEIFASITGLEIAYSKAPESMKSFIMSMFLVTNAFGAAIGCALSSVSEDPKYVWLYTGLAVTCFCAGIAFWFTFKHYNDEEDAMNNIDFESDNENEKNEYSQIENLELSQTKTTDKDDVHTDIERISSLSS